jgi:hypothetical protein
VQIAAEFLPHLRGRQELLNHKEIYLAHKKEFASYHLQLRCQLIRANSYYRHLATILILDLLLLAFLTLHCSLGR